MSTTLSAPFSLSGGRLKLTADQTTQVRQKIINVLVTNTLERVGLPDYGANMSAALFADLDNLAFDDFKMDVSQEVAGSVSGVNIIDIKWANSDVGFVDINVIYRLPLSTPEQFTLRLAIPGEVNEETVL